MSEDKPDSPITSPPNMRRITYNIDINIHKSNKKHRVACKKYRTPYNSYNIFNYEKGFVCFDDKISPMYRSIVVDEAYLYIYAFSPPKSIPIDDFIKTEGLFQDKINTNDIYVTQIVEGTMINLWFDYCKQRWEISTKNAVGGNYTFFRNHLFNDSDGVDEVASVGHSTFLRMFLDAIAHACGYENVQDVQDLHTIIEDIGWSNKYCYSFVLQHPQNHLVLKIDEPRLYLIAIYDAMQTWGSVEYVLPHTYLHWDWLWNSKMKKLYVPEPVEIRSYTELFKKYKSIHSDVGVGVMLTNVKTGTRSKIVSPRYLEIKEIRGNNPNLLFQYLTLVHIRKECHFLQFFPWYKSTFDHFNRLYSNFIINLFECYLNRYVRRTGEVISKKYMPHIYQIHHTIYLPAKKDPNAHIKRITLQEVMDYVKNVNPIDMYKSITT